MSLRFMGGQGYGYSSDKGKFIVKVEDEEFEFDDLVEARQFYNNLKVNKAIWDCSNDIPELLESHEI